MKTSHKLLLFLGLTALVVVIAKSNKKDDTTDEKSSFLGFKGKWDKLAKKWCQLYTKRNNLLKQLSAAHGLSSLIPLKNELATINAEMESIVGTLEANGYIINTNCKAVLRPHQNRTLLCGDGTYQPWSCYEHGGYRATVK